LELGVASGDGVVTNSGDLLRFTASYRENQRDIGVV
jgi:hypothetical protein